MRLAMAALVAGSGCAQIFGLDTTTSADANTDLAAVSVQRVSIGSTVNKGPQDLSGQTGKFIQMDGTEVDGALDLMGRFSADTPGTPSALVTVPSMTNPLRLLALGARVQALPFVVFEHPSPMAPGASAGIKLQLALPSMYATGESFAMSSIGAWMGYTLVAGDLPPPDVTTSTAIAATIPFTSFKPLVTGNAITRITSSDVTLVVRHTGSKLTGVFQSQFDQTDGTDTVSGTMTAVTADKTFSAAVDPAAVTSRFTAVRPGTAAPTFTWRVSACSGYSVGSDLGIQLDSATFTAGPTITTMYANPFESLDWHALATVTASSSRTTPYMYTEGANTVAVPLSTVSTQVGDAASLTAITMDAGLASTIQVDQTLLSTDGAAVKLDLTKPVPFSVVVDLSSNTVLEFTLVQLGIDTSGASPKLTRKIVLDGYTVPSGTMGTFSIPPELFATNKNYYVTVRTYKGLFTGAGSGDLTTLSLPYSTSAVDSAVFQVMP